MAQIYTDASLRKDEKTKKEIAQIGYYDKSYKEKKAIYVDASYFEIKGIDNVELLAISYALFINLFNNKELVIYNDNQSIVKKINPKIKDIKYFFDFNKNRKIEIKWLKRQENTIADRLSKETLLNTSTENSHFEKIENIEEFRVFYFHIRKMIDRTFSSQLIKDGIKIMKKDKNKEDENQKENIKKINSNNQKKGNKNKKVEWIPITKVPFNGQIDIELSFSQEIMLHKVIETIFFIIKSKENINIELITKMITNLTLNKYLRNAFIMEVVITFDSIFKVGTKINLKKLNEVYMLVMKSITNRRDLITEDIELLIDSIDNLHEKKVINNKEKLELLHNLIKNRKEMAIKKIIANFLESDDNLKVETIAKSELLSDSDILKLMNEHPSDDVKIGLIFNQKLYNEWFEKIMEFLISLENKEKLKDVLLSNNRAIKYIALNHTHLLYKTIENN